MIHGESSSFLLTKLFNIESVLPAQNPQPLAQTFFPFHHDDGRRFPATSVSYGARTVYAVDSSRAWPYSFRVVFYLRVLPAGLRYDRRDRRGRQVQRHVPCGALPDDGISAIVPPSQGEQGTCPYDVPHLSVHLDFLGLDAVNMPAHTGIIHHVRLPVGAGSAARPARCQC